MSASDEYGGMFCGAVVGHIHEGGDAKTGHAFEYEFLDVEAVHFNSSGDCCVEWRFLLWQAADHAEQFIPGVGLQLEQAFFVANIFEGLSACVVVLPHEGGLVLEVGSNGRAV